jgi:hypothetical protein
MFYSVARRTATGFAARDALPELLRRRTVVVSMKASRSFSRRKLRNLMASCLVTLAALTLPVGSPAADEEVPVPAPRPEQPGEAAAPAAKDAPVPEERPAQAGEPREKESLDPQDVPKPQARPTEPGDQPDAKPLNANNKPTKPDDADKNGDAQIETSNMPLPRPTVMPADEIACRVRLKELGVTFEERPQLADRSGCSVPWPIKVTALSSDVKLQPEAEMNCALAEREATFLKEHMAPKAKSILGSEIASIRQDSAYVCRPRNGTKRLSEHAFGNALDIGAFVLEDGRTITVGGASKRPEGEFMLAVRLAACGPFTTVLGPGSDADHATHFHFDLAKRRPGSTYCQ